MSRAALLLAVTLAASGCMSAELARVHRDVARDVPGLDGGHAPAFGPLTLGLARQFVDDPVVSGLLRHVRGVAVGTYNVDGMPADLSLVQARARIEARGWEPVVVSRDSTDTAFIYARVRGESIRDLLVVSFDGEDLTLVRLSGRLDEALAEALRSEDGIGVLGPVSARPVPTGG
ncbi:MAG TPA: DUF4252 domain-containing protein [Rubricoccaceae bacterium]|jgi:hypothetical protein